MLESARHFLFEDEPERCAQEVIDFLRVRLQDVELGR
jgi:hypothetical protein